MKENLSQNGLPAYCKVKDVASALNCTVAFVYELIALGKLEAIRLGPRAIRVSEASLLRLLKERAI